MYLSPTGLLQVHFAADFINCPIQQYCQLPGSEHYGTLVQPLTPSAVPPMNILWVPQTVEMGQNPTVNHVVPLLPWKCGAAPMKLCMFDSGRNSTFADLKKDLVQCVQCGEWYHCCCLGVTVHHARRTSAQLSCGCDVPILTPTGDCVTSKDP